MSEAEDGTAETGDTQYSEVSLRAVELLARAQRTADEAVAEAQAYARDLEASARAQYAQILQRAQVAARELSKSGGATEVSTATGSVAIVEEVDYVRTYARVAHAQLKTVLSALSDELDHLAAMAAGRPDAEVDATVDLPPSTIEASWPAPPDRVPDIVADDRVPASGDPADDDDEDGGSSKDAPAPRAAKLWTPDADDSDTSDSTLSGAGKTGWRSALQRKS